MVWMAVMASARVVREVILIPERTLRGRGQWRVYWTKGNDSVLTRLQTDWGESDQRDG
jgi:hypothetical protein